MAVDVADIVRVTTEIRSTGRASTEFGNGLLVTIDDTVLDASGADKIAKFQSPQGVLDAGFASTSEPYLAAAAWFSQSPAPQNLYIGRWNHAATAEARLTSGIIDLSVFASAISNGSVTIGGVNVGSISIGASPDIAAVAAALQTAIRAVATTPFGQATVTALGANRIVITIPSGATNQGSVGTAGSSGTDIADELALRTGDGATYTAAAAVENASEYLTNVESLAEDGFYYVMLDNGVPLTIGTDRTNALMAAAVGEGNRRLMFSMQESGVGALVANEAVSDAAIQFAAERRNVMVAWSRNPSYKHVSIAARMSAQDFNGVDSVITARFRNLPRQTPDTLERAEANELARKRVNWFTTVARMRSFRGGYTMNPEYFIDVQVFLDWLANQIEINQLTLLHRENVPQTAVGGAMLTSQVNSACEQGRRAGGLASGMVDAMTQAEIRQVTGNLTFDGNLVSGYLVFFESFSTQTQADRANRVAPDGHVWLKYRGAVHEVNVHALLLI